ncbi:hypothetical protein QM012_008244 [Aureobasidium pullulans]|uniref:Uncharacterized protein n=1 Tax=Aureobasidium pullulans TaxID=5580 RepID=A0ABR0TJ04_AURPU
MMTEQTDSPLEAGQDHLPAMPVEIQLEIFKHVVEAPDQQVFPSPHMRVSKTIKQHVVEVLTENHTLQLECRHPTSYHFRATSMYLSSGKGEYLRSPGLPTIKGSVVRWSKFRSLLLSAEMIGKVDSVYIKLSWMRDLSFTLLFHHNKPPTIKTHAWSHNSSFAVPLRPDLTRWTQQPVKPSVKWVEAFISDMRNQSYAHLAQHLVDLDRDLYAAAMREMKARQYGNHAVKLERNTTAGVPKILGIGEAARLRDTVSDLLKNRQVAREELNIELEERFGKFEGHERDE